MKHRIFILPFLLGSFSATALEFDIFYDANGECDTFCDFGHNGSGCCPDGHILTKDYIEDKIQEFIKLSQARDEQFSGFTLSDGTEFIGSDGELKLTTGTAVNEKATASDSELHTTNTCTDGENMEKNPNGVCVPKSELNANTKGAVGYVDWDSVLSIYEQGAEYEYEIAASQVKDNTGKGECGYDRDFDIVIHWCPENYTAVNYSHGGAHISYGANPVDWTGLPCESQQETWHYHWNGGNSLGVYTKNGVTQTEIVFPEATGWAPRGFYIIKYPEHQNGGNEIPYYSVLRTVADNLVTEKTSTWGTARLGLPFNQPNITDRIILNNAVGGYGDANANWQIWTCDGDIETVHLYAGWARKCDAGEDASCEQVIHRHGLNTSTYNKGDVEYRTGCDNASTPDNNGAYNPQCIGTLGACTAQEGMHWCRIDGDFQCIRTDNNPVGRDLCCNDSVTNCEKSDICAAAGGTWTAAPEDFGNYCEESGGGDTFQCPTLITASPKTVTLQSSNLENQTCTYKVNCDTGYTVSSTTPLTCTGTGSGSDACTREALAAKLNDYICTQQTPAVECPTKSDFAGYLADQYMSITDPTPINDNSCKYTLSCTGSEYTLEPSAPGTVTCTSSECTVSGVVSLITNQNYTCEYTPSCPTATELQLNVPDLNIKVNESSDCTYQLSCNPGYTLSGGTGQITCNDISACVTAMSGYQCMLTCPSVPSINNGTISKTDGINSCSYSLTCNDGYAVPDESANTTYNCTGDGCTSTGVNSWANALECKQKLTFLQCSAEFAEGDDGQAGGITGVLSENDTKCTFTANCDLLLCDAGSLGDTYCAGAKTCDSVSDCAQLAQKYATVSCSNAECPSWEKVNEVLVPRLSSNYVASLVKNADGGTYDCNYAVGTCVSGYQPVSDVSANGGAYFYAHCNKNTDPKCLASSNGWYSQLKCVKNSGGGTPAVD